MKRKGFTLAEILIALAIVGSVAAISIPMVHRIMPDKDKAIVLKVFKTVNEINDELINDPTMYRFNVDCQQHILQCSDRPLNLPDSDTIHNGNRKYPQLLSERLNLSDTIQANGNTYTFTTSDGVDWSLSGTATNGYTLTIDTNNPQREDCSYNSSSCKNPRKFSFQISNDAIITGSDPLTRAYLLNPDDLSDRNADLKKASEL